VILFRVECPTCRVRLKVTSRKLIGQIANCPKCGSMVEIREPATETKLPPSVEESQMLTESSMLRTLPGSTAPADEIFENVDDMLEGKTESPSVAESADQRFQEPAQTGSWRNMALIGGISIFSAVGVAIVGFNMLQQKNPIDEDPGKVAISQTDVEIPGETEAPEPKGDPDSPVETSVETQPAEQEPIESTKPPQDASVDKPESEIEKTSPPQETSQPEVLPTDDENPFLFGDPQSPDNISSDNPSSATKQPAIENENQASDDPVLTLGGEGSSTGSDEILEVFGGAFPIFDPNEIKRSVVSAPVTSQPEPVAPAPLAPKPVPTIPRVDVAERLKDPIVALDIQSQSLGEFSNFITQMSTVPVTLDPVALRFSRVTPQTNISVQSKQTSVHEVLNAAVSPFDLEFVATEKSARLQIRGPIDGKRRTVPFTLDDLAQTDSKMAELGYLVTHLVAPSSWQAKGGEGLILVKDDNVTMTQSEVVIFKSTELFEKLRLARGLPRRAKQKTSLTLEHRYAQVTPQIKNKMTVQIAVPTPMFQVIEQIEKKSGLTILCDWDSLAANGLGPASPVTISARDVTIETALTEFCADWKLSVLPIDSHTIQLVSIKTEPLHTWLEFYDASDLNLGKSKATAIINQAKSSLPDRSLELGEILYDGPSGHFLALLSKSDHRYFRQLISSLPKSQ